MKVKVDAYSVVSKAVYDAVERGMNRCDKYHEEPLTEGQRSLLQREIEASFWLALADNGVELC